MLELLRAICVGISGLVRRGLEICYIGIYNICMYDYLFVCVYTCLYASNELRIAPVRALSNRHK